MFHHQHTNLNAHTFIKTIAQYNNTNNNALQSKSVKAVSTFGVLL